MEYPVIHEGKTVGTCKLEEQGLYWGVQCSCEVFSRQIERLYCGTKSVGVLLWENGRLTLRRRLARSAWPELPPTSGILTTAPAETPELWSGTVLGHDLSGYRKGDHLLFPYDPSAPCPCEPLLCFFEIRDGFWQLPLEPTASLNGSK